MSSAGGARDGSPFSLFSSAPRAPCLSGRRAPLRRRSPCARDPYRRSRRAAPARARSFRSRATRTFAATASSAPSRSPITRTSRWWRTTPAPTSTVRAASRPPGSAAGSRTATRPTNCGQSTTVLPAVTNGPAGGQPDHGTPVHPEDPAGQRRQPDRHACERPVQVQVGQPAEDVPDRGRRAEHQLVHPPRRLGHRRRVHDGAVPAQGQGLQRLPAGRAQEAGERVEAEG